MPVQLSVVMPMRNAGPFVHDAVASVLAQSYRDFVLVVVDDGSTDDGPAVVRGFRDDRIVVLPSMGRGIAAALTTGLVHVRTPLVARMDADDLSLPERFAQQITALEQQPATVALGTSSWVMDVTGERTLAPLLTRDRELRRSLVYKGPFCHGSVMMRRSALDAAGGYRSAEEPAEDYGLWIRLAAHGELANLAEPLYCLRVGPHSVSHRRRPQQITEMLALRRVARAAVGAPRLTARDLQEGYRFYASQDDVARARFVREVQELALADACDRGVRAAARNLALAAALGLREPRSLRAALSYVRYERSLTSAAA